MIIKLEHLLGLLFFRYAEVILTIFRIYDYFNQTFFFFLNAEYFIKNEQYLHSTRIYYLLFSWSMDFSVLTSWVFHSNLPDSPNGEWPHFYCNILQFSSVTWSCPILWDPMDCSTPGFPVHHQLPKHTQTHVHWVGDGIQPSHPLSSPSPPALNLSQNQGLLKWVNSSPQVAKVLEFQHQSFQWIFRTNFL